MIFEIIILCLFGISIGIITGLTPGIHVNLVATAMLSISPILLQFFEPLSLAAFIISLSLTHSFLDTIPSIYLGAPENENALSILPGQKMLLQGDAHQAVKITIVGTFFGLILAIIMIPLFIFSATIIYSLLKPYLAVLLILITGFLIFKEKNPFYSLFLFLLSGTLGIIVFSAGVKDPLFPLLSGLFGISGLIISFSENTKIPKQNIDTKIDLKPLELIKAVFGSSVGVLMIQFFPGFGPAQGAVISSQLIKNIKDKTYLALVGAQGTMSVVFSLVTFYTLGKAKDGSISAISRLLQIDFNSFLLLIVVMLFSGSISVFLVLRFSKIFSILITKINYRLLIISIITFIIAMCFLLNGPFGILILITSSAIGLIAPLKGIPRNHAMGCLILPVMMYLIL